MQTFRSLNVFAAVNRTDMGKKTDESAGGTTNSIDPLPMFKWWKQNTLSTTDYDIQHKIESKRNFTIDEPAIWVINEKYGPLQDRISGVVPAGFKKIK